MQRLDVRYEIHNGVRILNPCIIKGYGEFELKDKGLNASHNVCFHTDPAHICPLIFIKFYNISYIYIRNEVNR